MDYIQRLANDGQSLLGEPQRLIANNRSWEEHLVEAPTLWRHLDRFHLFYSAGDFASARYAVGYAVAENIWGPYHKASAPFLTTDSRRGWIGPGGQDILIGPGGGSWMVFHAWSGDCRSLNIGRLRWQMPATGQ